VASHVKKGERYLDHVASRLVEQLCQTDDRALGFFKQSFILISTTFIAQMKSIDNGWDTDVAFQIAQEFSLVLRRHLYKQEEGLTDVSGSVPTDSASPWRVIYSVICIFDRHIIALQTRE
jgi:hypothetical protein